MRPEFLIPDSLFEGPDISTREMVQSVLELVSIQVPAAEISRWTRFELILAYDWAWRRHLVASDHPRRLLRDKPSFVAAAQAKRHPGTALGEAGIPATSHPGSRAHAR